MSESLLRRERQVMNNWPLLGPTTDEAAAAAAGGGGGGGRAEATERLVVCVVELSALAGRRRCGVTGRVHLRRLQSY